VKYINGSQGSWREVQNYKNYIYITQDNNGNANSEGILIYDLNTLPAGKVDTFRGSNSTNVILRTHSLYIDEKGFLYLNGGRTNINGSGNNGVVIYDLKPNPKSPTFVGFTPSLSGTTTNYVHDSYVRNDTMYQAHIYNNRFTIWDIRNRATPVKIADYAENYNSGHNMWLSDDSKKLYVTHESAFLPVTVYDISDVNDIKFIHEFKNTPTESGVAHNVHVKDDYLIISHYKRGVIIFDASVPDNVVRVGYYDSSPNFDNTAPSDYGHGVWGAFGFYKSGLLTISDMEEGMLVLRPTYVRACRIQGVVRDTNTRQLLSAVTISFVDTTITATTNFEGFYKSGTARAGATLFKAEKAGYITKFFTVNLTNGVTDTVNIDLRQIPILVSRRDTFCEGTNFTLPSGSIVTEPGIYTSNFILPSGKDSTITTTLIQKDRSQVQFNDAFCQGGSYTLPWGTTVTAGGSYSLNLTNSIGCDSVITYTLTELPVTSATQHIEICEGESHVLPDASTTSANGTFTYSYTNSNGCDSTLTVRVSVNPVYTIFKTDSFPSGTIYTLPDGNLTNAPGVFTLPFSTTKGCDSTIVLDLKLQQLTSVRNLSNTLQLNYILTDNLLQLYNPKNNAIVQLDIYNSTGALIQQFYKPENSILLPVLPKDVYILRAITQKQEQHIQKLVIY
jgi:choice-of-anchor B domain-containing protein